MKENGSMAVSPRSQRPAESRSHEDIYDAIENMRGEMAAAATKAEKASADVSVYTMAVQGLQKEFKHVLDAVSDLAEVVGKSGTDEHGKLVGTGLAGGVARLTEHVGTRFRVYDRWRYLAMGAAGAVVPSVGIIWWLLSTKLDHLLR